MTFLKTLWAHPRECRIFVGVVLGTDNRYGLKLIVTQSSNFMIHFFILSMKVSAVKKELLKIFIKACKSARLLVHG